MVPTGVKSDFETLGFALEETPLCGERKENDSLGVWA